MQQPTLALYMADDFSVVLSIAKVAKACTKLTLLKASRGLEILLDDVLSDASSCNVFRLRHTGNGHAAETVVSCAHMRSCFNTCARKN